jgi:sporulation protein YlmC with PRC-barrel domain
MVKVRPEADRRKNYDDAATYVPGRYKSGIDRCEWQAPALEGQALYETQMKKDEILSRRGKSIAKVTDAQFKTDAKEKGGNVIGPRMKAAVDKQVTGWRPFGTALEGLTLVPKTDDPEQNTINRVVPVVLKMVETKKAQKGW